MAARRLPEPPKPTPPSPQAPKRKPPPPPSVPPPALDRTSTPPSPLDRNCCSATSLPPKQRGAPPPAPSIPPPPLDRTSNPAPSQPLKKVLPHTSSSTQTKLPPTSPQAVPRAVSAYTAPISPRPASSYMPPRSPVVPPRTPPRRPAVPAPSFDEPGESPILEIPRPSSSSTAPRRTPSPPNIPGAPGLRSSFLAGSRGTSSDRLTSMSRKQQSLSMSGSESPSNCQTRPFSVMVGVAGGPGEGRKKAVKSGGGSGSKKLAKVSSTSWAIDNLRLRLSNKIEEGALREMLVGAASSTTPSGDSLVTPDEAIACFEAFLTEFFQPEAPPKPEEAPPTPKLPAALCPEEIQEPPKSTEEKVKQAIHNGDVLNLNRILKTMDIEQFMGLCLVPSLHYNPLHYACLEGQYQVVHLLLKKNADPTLVAKEEGTYAVHLFVKEGLGKAIAAIEKSYKSQEEENETEPEPRYSFLVPVVQRLLAGVPIDMKTASGDTLLHYACESAPAEITQILFDKGANPNIENNEGLLPFHILMDKCTIKDQKHLILQQMQEKLEVSRIADELGDHLENAAHSKNKDLFNTLVQFEFDVKDEIYFQPGLLDFPVELSSAEEGSVALLKCATFEKLLEKVIIEDHGDEEAYAAFCFKIHVFGSLEEVLERLLLVLEERREVGEIGGVCKFLNFFFQQPFFEKGDPLFNVALKHLPQEGSGSKEEENLREVILNQHGHAERAEILERLEMFGTLGETPLNNFGASDLAKHLTMWNMYLHQALSEIDVIRYAEFSAKLEKGEAETLDQSIRASLHRVQKAITFFNNVSFWAAGAVLLEEGEARREKLAFVIKVMDLCMMCKNYNTAFSVLLGLKLRAVSQLPGLFDSLGEQTQARFQAVSNLFSYHGSYKNYRDTLKGVHAPAIPYLGLLLRDTTYANDGSADLSGKKQNFNIYKQRRISKLVRQYHSSFYSKPYDFNISLESAQSLARISELSGFVNQETLFALSKSSTRGNNRPTKSDSDLSELKQTLRDLYYGSYQNQKCPIPTPAASTCDSPFSNSSTLMGKMKRQHPSSLETLKSESEALIAEIQKTQGHFSEDSEEENYRVAITSGDGFSLGHLDMVPDPQNPTKTRLQLNMSSQSKSVTFRLERLGDRAGCIALFSSTCHCYVGTEETVGEEEEGGGELKVQNYINTLSAKWKIHVNDDYSEPQQFYTEIASDGTEVLRAGSTNDPLQFTLQRVNNIMKNALPELERLGLASATKTKTKKSLFSKLKERGEFK